MCGRFTLRQPKETIITTFNVDQPNTDSLTITPRFNIAPTQSIVAVAAKKHDPTKRGMALLSWGFYPAWSDGRVKPINAKGETVATSGMFRHAFTTTRCLLPADGFIEWKAEGKHKEPYLFRLASEEMFAFAGLYTTNKSAGASCCIITTTPNTLVAEVHNRMPVILHASTYARWLDPQTPLEDLQALLVPFPDDEMEACAISDIVNSAKNEGPQCLAPVPHLYA